MMKRNLLSRTLLLLLMVVGGVCGAWAQDVTIATATFNGSGEEYTEGWSTTGTGKGRADCVIIGKDENITSPAFDLSGYSKVTITFTGRRFGTLSGSKATVDVAIAGTSQGTIDITKTSVGTVSGSIEFTPTPSMTAAVLVFTCTNATSAGSTHGAGIGSITIKGQKMTSPLSSISITGSYPTSFYTGDTFSHEGALVTAQYEDNSSNDVTDDASFSGYDMTTSGKQTVTVSYTEGGITKTTSYNITVTERPKFTVTLGDDDTELTETVAAGGVLLPTREDVGYYVFKGWGITNLLAETETAPTILSGEYFPSENITLYPIYQRTEGNAEDTHTVNIGEYATANKWTTTDGKGQYFSVNLDEFVTASVTPASGHNGKVYTNNDIVNWRIYDGATLTITSTSDNIISVKISTQDSGFGFAYNGTKLQRGETFSDISPSNSIELSNNGATSRITDIEIVTSNVVKYYISTPATNLVIPVAKEYISYCSPYALDFTNVDGLEALVVTKINDTSVSTEAVTTVPARVGVILHKDPECEATSFNVPVAATATAPAGNKLVGVLEATAIGGNNTDYTDYVLKGGKFMKASAGTLPAGKAYLHVEAPANAAPALTIGFGDEGTTGIRSIDNGQLTIDNVYYDLSGRRVAEPTKGVYIVNGKKVVIK